MTPGDGCCFSEESEQHGHFHACSTGGDHHAMIGLAGSLGCSVLHSEEDRQMKAESRIAA